MLLDDPTRVVFFTGKGGMGKTTLACATAVALAARGRRVLIVSTDPASNLDEVLQTALGEDPRSVGGVDGLDAVNIDPEAAAAAHREAVVGPYRGVLPDSAIASMQESLSGACTIEIAAFDAFATLLADPDRTRGYDHVIFDTAPTGHTLRLLKLPGAWTDFIDTNTTGTSCLGPLAGLQAQRELYAAAVAALADPAITTLVLVSRPQTSALREAAPASRELRAAGMDRQLLAVNGRLIDPAADDATAAAYAREQAEALAAMPASLAGLARHDVALAAGALLGAAALANVLCAQSAVPAANTSAEGATLELPLGALIDDLAATGHGVLMTMGKGGVGKTTIAAAIAIELARRGHEVLLTTTDPAAGVHDAVGEPIDGLQVSRIDPDAVTAAYRREVLDGARDLDQAARALLDEDLRSPCTEEIAVFRAFAEAVADGSGRFVVLDTAPTGHTLLLLDAAQAYHREVQRGQGHVPDAVQELLPRLRDPYHTKVLIITLPEPTPVHEAQRLASDLQRAAIQPYAWIINQSLAATDTRDPVLCARAHDEHHWIDTVLADAPRAAIIEWHPAGAHAITT